MVTGELKSQIDAVWNAFWTGGISNPLEVIEQITYLLFIKRLDELHTAEEKKANRLGRPIENAIFEKDEQQLHPKLRKWNFRFALPGLRRMHLSCEAVLRSELQSKARTYSAPILKKWEAHRL